MRAASPTPSAKPDTHGSGLSFWDHLEELRHVIFQSLGVVALCCILLFCLMPEIFEKVILAPCRPDFPTYRLLQNIVGLTGLDSEGIAESAIELVNINLTSQLMIHLSASFWLAIVIASPVLLYFIWRFISPALYKDERNNFVTAITGGSLMFYLGILTSYYIVFPLTLNFLAGYQLSSMVPNVISLDSYMDTLTGLTLIMGLTFELPIVAWIAGRLGVIDRSLFGKFRRHAVVILLVIAALITPTGDPLTLSVVFLPLYLLWELSALAVPAPKREEAVSC